MPHLVLKHRLKREALCDYEGRCLTYKNQIKINLEESDSLICFVKQLQSGIQFEDAKMQIDNSSQIDKFYQKLLSLTLLETDVFYGGQFIMTVMPQVKHLSFVFSSEVPREPRVTNNLSMRIVDDNLEISSPFSEYKVLFTDHVAAKIFIGICLNSDVDESNVLTLSVIKVLFSASFLISKNDVIADFKMLSHLDLQFHYSTLLMAPIDYNASARRSAKFPRPGALAKMPEGRRIALAPNLSKSPFVDLLAKRRTAISYSNAPLSYQKLSDLLFTCCRNTGHDKEQDIVSRNYPSAGGLHPLEFYLIIRAVENIEPGLYKYDCALHSLILLDSLNEKTNIILEATTTFKLTGTLPQAHLLITARLDRISAKYERIAYRLALLDAGVFLQNLYLACADLEIGIRPRGSSFSRFIEHDLLKLTGLSEFAILEAELGSPKR